MHRGIALLMKKNKYFDLPNDTSMQSSASLRFIVQRSNRIDAYTMVIYKPLFLNQEIRSNKPNDAPTNFDSKRKSIVESGFLWLSIG